MARYRRVPRATSQPTATAAPATFRLTLDSEKLGNLKKDELVRVADASGVDSSGTKADILARLEGSR